MSRRYKEGRVRESDNLGQRNRQLRPQNQKYQAEDVRKSPYQPGDIQRRQMEVREVQRRRQANDIRTQRYQQEILAGDWQQDWDRRPYDYRNDKRFTSGQFVLVLIIMILMLTLAAMAVFWYTGRSSLSNASGSETRIQQNRERTEDNELPDDNIIILDIENNE